MKHSKIESLFNAERKSSQEIFAVLHKEKWTYGDLLGKIDRINGHVDSIGLEVGDRVLISTENDYSKMLLFLFSLRKGIVPILLHPDVNVARAKKILEETTPAMVMLDEALFDKWSIGCCFIKHSISVKKESVQQKGKLLKKLLKKDPIKQENLDTSRIHFDDIIDGTRQSSNYPSEIKGDDIAYILYTSGTTANPKGVIITHKNLFTHLETMSRIYQLQQSSRIMNVLSLEHADGMIMGPLLALFSSSTLIRPLKFEIGSIPHVLSAMYKYRVSHFIAVPAMLSLIDRFSDDAYDDSFENEEFKMIISVSSHIEEKLWTDFTSRFGVRIVNVYGLTETVGGSFFCGPDDASYKLGTIGKPIDTIAKIVDEDFRELGPNQEGELVMKGDHISPGYFKNKEATKEVFREDWLLTGDLAVQDEDGFYRITGRKKNLVIAGGFNIHPEEVNEVIVSHEGILDSCCVGIPDSVFGDKLVAAVVSTDSSIDKFTLSKFCKDHLEPYKVPSAFYFFNELPKGISGKHNLPKLKELIVQSSLPESHENQLENRIVNVASEAFNITPDKITLNSNSQNLEGWDSLAHLDFITRLEKEFNKSFNTAEIITMNSIRRVVSILTEHEP
ncbi:AMP-binding protein [Ekhidna sp.]|uniref:AMP-binding protein n=1 Tax=Ekhidna sp. TaxID=2608089 RepID=UPI003297246E